MWQTVGQSQILAFTNGRGTAVGDLSPLGEAWSAIVFGRGSRGGFRRARLFEDEEEAKNWIVQKVKQIITLLGLTSGSKTGMLIHVPRGAKVYSEGKYYKMRHGAVVLSEPIGGGGGYSFRMASQRCYVPKGIVKVVPIKSVKATWYEWIAKDLEKAGTTAGDGLQLLNKAFNRLSRAVSKSPDPRRAKRAWDKTKLSLTLLDKSLDFMLDAQKIILGAER